MKPQDLHTFAAALMTAPLRVNGHADPADTLAGKVDRLGLIRAQIDALQADYNKIRAELEDAGLPAIDGHFYRATFSTSTRTTTDWQAIAQRFKPSAQLIRAHTKTSDPSTACKVAARKTH